jgi:hypothetical protein
MPKISQMLQLELAELKFTSLCQNLGEPRALNQKSSITLRLFGAGSLEAQVVNSGLIWHTDDPDSILSRGSLYTFGTISSLWTWSFYFVSVQ